MELVYGNDFPPQLTIVHLYCRLFDIGDELPPQYHLATVQEFNDHQIAFRKTLPYPRSEIANLADGSVAEHPLGMKTR